jgi:hypothetical protein
MNFREALREAVRRLRQMGHIASAAWAPPYEAGDTRLPERAVVEIRDCDTGTWIFSEPGQPWDPETIVLLARKSGQRARTRELLEQVGARPCEVWQDTE